MNHNNNLSKKKIMYNKKDLHISSENTLIIIDWDDTLYPTSWTMENGIDLTDPRSRAKYMSYFEKLDENLSSALSHMTTLGEVIIITNAMPEWVELSVSVLPKTKKCLKKIEVISARLRYQNKTKMNDWKKYTFQEEIIARSQNKKYHNIMSLGDAEFEHNALVNLYKLNTLAHKYLKSIKFIKSTEYSTLLDQIIMIRLHIAKLCKAPRHIDMKFETK
jgi:hypothetical protein